jgi:hypothetical protein
VPLLFSQQIEEGTDGLDSCHHVGVGFWKGALSNLPQSMSSSYQAPVGLLLAFSLCRRWHDSIAFF